MYISTSESRSSLRTKYRVESTFYFFHHFVREQGRHAVGLLCRVLVGGGGETPILDLTGMIVVTFRG